MPTTQTFIGVLVVMECGNCHCHFGMSQEQYDRCLRDGDTFYCTNGHPRVFVTTENQKLKEKVERLERRVTSAERATRFAEFETHYERRSKAAIKGHLTRMRNRVAAGACPVSGCKRHFTALQRHLGDVHPGWLEEHDLTLAALETSGT